MSNVAPETSARPGAGKTKGRPYPGSNGRSSGGPLRLVETLRGDGVLVWTGGTAAVAYQLDIFEGRMGRSGSGSLEGAPPELDGDARLQLSDTAEVAVTLIENADGQAVIETRGGVVERTAAKTRRGAKP
jgi:hypothetical protein